MWMAIAVLALGLAVQSIGCATPEERHRVLTIFFDGVPPLYPEEEFFPAGEEFAEDDPLRPARRRGAKPILSVHGPVAKKACEECHSGRFSNRLKAKREDLCWNCHDPENFTGQVIHGPVAAGYCQGCHDPHKSVNKFLLISEAADLCEGCHEQYDTVAVVEHRDIEAVPCQSCHDPHAAELKYMLKRDEEPL
jgi:predicted CXXCH cytochrome family protein